MASRVGAGSTTAAHLSPWAGVRQNWVEIVTGLVLAIGVGLSWRFRNDLSVSQHLLAGALLLPVLVLFIRRLWIALFGPVLFYDLVRVSRRSQYIWLRSLYAAALLFLLYWQYSEWFSNWLMTVRRWRGVPLPQGQMLARSLPDFAERFFNVFMILQFFLVFWLTPVYAATCIAEEKDRKTLDYLLATDLSSREIVLSKLLSRLANLCLIVLTGLPILGFLQFLGGVDPNLVLAGFAATGITMVSLTSLSVLCSVYARKPRDAILLSYLCLLAYVGLGFLLEQIRALPFATIRLIPGPRPITLGDLVKGFNAGNLPLVLADLRVAWAKGVSLATLVSDALWAYAACHAVVTALCVTWAVARLRVVALSQNAAKQVRAVSRRWRPRLALRPMVWKEVFIEPGFRLTRMGRVVVLIFVIISLTSPVWIAVRRFLEVQRFSSLRPRSLAEMLSQTWNSLGLELNPWVRATGTILGCLMLIGVAARASTSISGERDRDTLDSLLTSPLQSHDILFAKWLGSLLSVRWVWLWLGTIWLIGMITGAMHPLVVPLYSIAWLVYASCLAGIGLWFSTLCRSTLRSTMCTLSATAVLGGGHYLLYMCCMPLGALQGLGNELSGILSAFTPVNVLYRVTANPREVGDISFDLWAIAAYFGLFLWMLLALALWTFTRSRFRRITARMPYRRPGLLDGSAEWQKFSSGSG